MRIPFRSVCLLASLLAWGVQASAQTTDAAPAGPGGPGEMPIELELPPVGPIVSALADSLFLPPEGRARIIRDRYGVPHIYGLTDADVAFGFGYAQAEDHLLPMLLLYRQAAGRLAEVKGRAYIFADDLGSTIRHSSGNFSPT